MCIILDGGEGNSAAEDAHIESIQEICCGGVVITMEDSYSDHISPQVEINAYILINFILSVLYYFFNISCVLFRTSKLYLQHA